MQNPPSSDAVVVSRDSVESDDAYDIIESNIDFVNALFQEYLRTEEVAPDALRSYYVDFYLAQVNNGGFSQFVYNSGWNPTMMALIREGLSAMGAREHLALFEEGAALVDKLGAERLEEYFESEYFGENEERDFLNTVDDRFYELQEREDLIALNARWLRSLPHLVALTTDEMQAEIARRAAALPDREQRIAAALANEPRYMKLIRALCARQGYTLERVTAGDPSYVHNGLPASAWHFLTDHGHHFMVEADGKALLFRGDTRQCIAEIEAPE